MALNILVCIKRVPSTGARIVLTEDEQEIETRNLGFTIGPHEECAVEEAIQLAEQHGGRTTVLTLGVEAAVEQLRDSLAMGIDNAVFLNGGKEEWDPMATSSAIVEAIRSQQEEEDAFDIILFGNEAADTGGYQVGIRVAHALDLPSVTGIKDLEISEGMATARKEAAGGWEIYQVQLPAVFTIKEGINLPRYPSLPGRLRAKKKPVTEMEPTHNPGGPRKTRLRTPVEQTGTAEVLGNGPEAASQAADILKEMGVI